MKKECFRNKNGRTFNRNNPLPCHLSSSPFCNDPPREARTVEVGNFVAGKKIVIKTNKTRKQKLTQIYRVVFNMVCNFFGKCKIHIKNTQHIQNHLNQ